MMELKEGMYVRSNLNSINKIIAICPDREKPYVFKIDDEHCEVYGYKEYQIKKASYNIIDLIEVGDYVNGHPVTLICEDEIHPQNKCLRIYGRGYVWQKGIKSIVTKEMFSNAEYRVETD